MRINTLLKHQLLRYDYSERRPKNLLIEKESNIEEERIKHIRKLNHCKTTKMFNDIEDNDCKVEKGIPTKEDHANVQSASHPNTNSRNRFYVRSISVYKN